MTRHYKTVQCQEVTCGVKFTTASPQTKYCPACKEEVNKEQTTDSFLRRKKYTTNIIRVKEPEKEHWLSRHMREKKTTF